MHFEIVVGSVLGACEYVAEAVEEELKNKGHEATVHLQPEFSKVNFDNTIIVITSTHGAGDLPDNIQKFEETVAQNSLPKTEFIVIGLGDSSYDTFCHGAITMEETFTETGATLLYAPIHIDVLHHPVPEDEALVYLEKVLVSL